MADICQKKHLNRSEDLQRQFLNITWFEVFETHDPSDRYDDFVIDSDDAQILQDAVESWAGYILTNNTKDFHIKKIYDTFHVLVIDDILQAIE